MLNKAAVLIFLAALCVYGNLADQQKEIDESDAQYDYGLAGEAEARKPKHKKLLLPIIIGALLIKSILFPLAFKVMAVMSAISVVVSMLSLILSAIIGFFKMGAKENQAPTSVPIHFVQTRPAWDKDGYQGELITSAGIDLGFRGNPYDPL